MSAVPVLVVGDDVVCAPLLVTGYACSNTSLTVTVIISKSAWVETHVIKQR